MSLTGSPTVAVLGWNAGLYPVAAVWFYSRRETWTGITAVGAVCTGGASGVIVYLKRDGSGVVTEYSKSTTACGPSTMTITLSTLASTFTGGNVVLNTARVFPVMTIGAATYASANFTGLMYGTGSYHTYTYTTNDGLDRNMGNEIGSVLYTPATSPPAGKTTNVYNFTWYASLNGDFVTGKINSGVSVFVSATGTNFNIYTALGIGDNKGTKQDYSWQDLTGMSWDTYAATGGFAMIKKDIDQGCTNQTNSISFGKSTSLSNIWYYSHWSRSLISSDLSCDTQILTNFTSICGYGLTGDTSLTALAAEDTTLPCVVFTSGKLIAALIPALLLLAL